MRTSLIALALLTAGCVQQPPPQPRPLPTAVANAPCTPEVLLRIGQQHQAYPERCKNGDPVLIERYRLGFEITRVERRIKAIEHARHQRRTFNTPVILGGRDRSDYAGPFRGDGGLTVERARLRSRLKNLKAQAGIL